MPEPLKDWSIHYERRCLKTDQTDRLLGKALAARTTTQVTCTLNCYISMRHAQTALELSLPHGHFVRADLWHSRQKQSTASAQTLLIEQLSSAFS